MSTAKASAPSSESPLRAKQREFLETFLKKGQEFTEELIRENERLRFRVAELEVGGTNAPAENASPTAGILRELAGRVETLEAERDDLLRRFHRAAQESEVVERRYLDIERENDRLASLYVAATQLHSSMDLREVVQVVHEVLLNFLGAKKFRILLRDEGSGRLLTLSSESIDADVQVPTDRGMVAQVLGDGEPRFLTPLHGAPFDPLTPRVCEPLRIGNAVVGAVAIWEFLAQKFELTDVDTELLRLIGGHAAMAIVGALLYADAKDPPLAAERCVALVSGRA